VPFDFLVSDRMPDSPELVTANANVAGNTGLREPCWEGSLQDLDTALKKWPCHRRKMKLRASTPWCLLSQTLLVPPMRGPD
jgi:hypothetical protein